MCKYYNSIDQFTDVESFFLSASNLNHFKWNSLLGLFDCDYEESQENQIKLLESTVNHPLVKKYPLKRSYQQYFLKTVLRKLEQLGVEVSELLYQKYVDLLREDASGEAEDYHYKHYRLPNGEFVSLSEKLSIISHGTTGLCSWQGALALTDWLWKNKDLIRNKTVLELGSGTGLAGLSLLSFCQPTHYYFSDCHSEVLKQLLINVQLNLTEVEKQNCSIPKKQDSDITLWRTNHRDIIVEILDLPWESVAELKPNIFPDIILASDVVYDSSLFQPLINALEYFLKGGTNHAIFTCTVRNEITLNNFIELLGTRHLKAAEIGTSSSQLPHSDFNVPIKTFKIIYMPKQ